MLVRFRTVALLAVAVIASAGLSACGSSAESANSLLSQTFSGTRQVQSGNMSFAISVTPSGSSSIKTPISLSRLAGRKTLASPVDTPMASSSVAV